MVRVPAAIRYKNPGAMWGKGNPLTKKWGSTQYVMLNDGLGQGNNIAVFPDYVHGAAAQMDLWRSKYTGRTLAAAIRRWSGGNWSAPYATYLTKNTGIGMDEMVTVSLLASDRGWKLMKFQASWEAGPNHPWPMIDEDWKAAQRLVFSSVTTEKVKKVVIAAGSSGGVATAANQAMASGLNEYVIYGLIAVAVIGIGYWLYRSIRNV
jgi:hypothetical protein